MTASSLGIARRTITPAELAGLLRSEPDSPVLAGLRQDLIDCFRTGPRALLLSGIDPRGIGEADFAAALLKLGGWLGVPSIQSPQGELVARVEHDPADLQARGTHSDSELQAHTDLHDILALACVHPAELGGESFLVAAGELHDCLLERHRECLAALRTGYYFGINPVLQSDHPVSEAPVPVLFDAGERKLVCWNGYFMRMAALHRNEQLPSALVQALIYLRELAAELAERCRFTLAPGDILFWHNWSWLHGRTAFEDGSANRRRLLRLWLRSDLIDRPPILAERGARIDADHRLTQQLGYRAP